MDLKNIVPAEMLDQVYEVDHYKETWETILEYDSESLECFRLLKHEENLKAIYLIPRLMSGSDYCGDSVNKSNYRVFLAEFKEDKKEEANGILSLYGAYSSYGIAIRLDVLKEDEEMQNCLKELCNYPLMNEDDLSHLEMVLQEEAWTDYVKSDFENEIEDGLGIDDLGEIGLDDDEKIFNLFRYLEEKTNTYWQIETGCTAYIDLKRIMENFDEDFKLWKRDEIERKNGQKLLTFAK